MRSGRSATGMLAPVAEPGGLGRRMSWRLAGGFTLLAVGVGLIVALATWSVDDPSFNHATTRPARNLLGFPGAVAADLLMQVFGLAAIALALVFLVWSLQALRLSPRDPDRRARARLRTAAWAAGLVLLAGALATLPVLSGWPLPVGLGGVVGDMVLKLAAAALGDGGGGRAAAGLVFWPLGAGLLLLSAFGLRAAKDPTRAAEPPRRRLATPFDDGDDERDEGGRFMPLALVHHWWLSARAKLKRFGVRRPAFVPRRPRRSEDWEDALPESVAVGRRIEPAVAAPSPARLPRPEPKPAPRPVAPPEPEDEADAFDPDFFEGDEEPPPPPPPPPPKRPPAAPTRGPAARVLNPPPTPAPRAIPVAPRPKAIEPAPEKPAGPDGWRFPPLSLLAEPKRLGPDAGLSRDTLERNAGLLEGVLEDYGIRGQIIEARPGPVVTLYELEPAPGIKSSRVIGLSDDIARSMSAVSARVAVVPGRNVIGIELPNQRRETVFLRELLAAREFEDAKARLALCLGKTIGGEPVIADLARMPHLLVAGTTGSGKSVSINTMILSLVYRLTPQQCKLIMIDPKMLELSVYDGIPHLLSPVVTDPKKAVVALKWTVREMEDRYRKMSKLSVRNIDGYNARVTEAAAKGEGLTRTVQTGFDRETGEPIYEEETLDLQPMPYIVVIVDEMADLMMVAGKDIEGAIQRLAQMARAAGIHIVMATQRPSVDVITGTIKANFPTRISFQVTSKIDSRTILGEMGAEQLLGQGDMLLMAGGGRIQRVHGAFVSDAEVEKVVAHLKKQGAPDYLDAITADDDESGESGDGAVFDKGAFGGEDAADLYEQAVALVLRDRKASTSYVQRRLQIGYNRAASLIERMEKEGLVGPANHAGKREILVGKDHED